MRFTSWNTPTATPAWRGAYVAIWLLGGGLVCVYAIKTLGDFDPGMDWTDWLGRLGVVALFAAALIFGHRRFARYRTIKYFCITAVTTLFLLVMDATRFSMIPLEDYRAIVMLYVVAMLFLAGRHGESRER